MLKIEELDKRIIENKRYLGNNIYFCPRIQSELKLNDEGKVEYIEYKGVDVEVIYRYTKYSGPFDLKLKGEELIREIIEEQYKEELRIKLMNGEIQ